MNRPLRHTLIALLLCAGALLGQGTTAPRDTSSLQKSLLGHWVSRSAVFGDSHYYFADGKLALVDSGYTRDMTYTLLEANPKERRLRIRVLMPSGLGHDKNFEFSPDAASIASTIKDFEETEYKTPSTLTYVDAKQVP